MLKLLWDGSQQFYPALLSIPSKSVPEAKEEAELGIVFKELMVKKESGPINHRAKGRS